MIFKERKTKPLETNKYYYSKLNFDYPKLVDQCVWYAWGRCMENGVSYEEMKKKIPQTNAENWYTDTKFTKHNYPSVGDVLCYSAGKIHHKSDGMGHVAMVEKVNPDLSIFISESGPNMKFKTRTIKPPYKYYLNVPMKENYKLDGFIHTLSFENVFEWTTGEYKVLYPKYLRTSPEVKLNNKALWKELTKSAKEKTYPYNGFAKYRIGAIIKLKEFTADTKGNIWGRTNQLWVCVQDTTGYQVEKVL